MFLIVFGESDMTFHTCEKFRHLSSLTEREGGDRFHGADSTRLLFGQNAQDRPRCAGGEQLVNPL